MDSLTHIVVGACVGELIAGKKLGKKAMLLGAIGNSIPDIDVVASFWLPITKDLLAHRGFTHSILFALLVSPLLAWLCTKLFKKVQMSFNIWMLFWFVEILLHLFIDSLNAYGTGLFEPFSHYRVSFNTMFVADPLFTIWPIIAFITLLILRSGNNKRVVVARGALVLSGMYMLAGIVFKLSVDAAVVKDLKEKNIAVSSYFTTPTPLNNLLWYVVAQNDSGYYIGYRSVFDRKRTIEYHYTYRNDQLLRAHEQDADLGRLIRFSKGYYTADQWHDTLVFNDMRFGEIAGWEEPHPRFIFYYFLKQPSANDLLVQRGRFAKWDKRLFASFINRIRGN
ncbi:MAG: Protein of unknown function transrane [Flavipsychrobacter sp.]|nr:Protein of unknown function transrane [Flavipsychrobacter sp.]